MKIIPILSAVVFTAAAVSSYAQTESGAMATQGYLSYGASTSPTDGDFFGGPHRWSLGAFMDHDLRPVTIGGEKDTWQNDRLMAFVGFDPLTWITLQAGAGSSSLDLGDGSRDNKAEWQLALRLRLLEYMIVDPPIGNEPYWLGIEAMGRFDHGRSDGELGIGNIEWDQYDAALTFHLSSRPERWMTVDKIDIFAGPGVSTLDGTRKGGVSGNIRADNEFGFVGGLVFTLGSNFSLGVNVADFGDLSYGGEVVFHF